MSIGSHVDIYQFGDPELAVRCGVKRCYVLDEICIDSKREIKSGSKKCNGRTSLESDTESSFESCRPRRADDW